MALHMLPTHDGMSRSLARVEFGHSPDPFWWPRTYTVGGVAAVQGQPVLLSSELPKVEPKNIAEFEVLADMLMEAFEVADDEDEFTQYIIDIKEL